MVVIDVLPAAHSEDQRFGFGYPQLTRLAVLCPCIPRIRPHPRGDKPVKRIRFAPSILRTCLCTPNVTKVPRELLLHFPAVKPRRPARAQTPRRSSLSLFPLSSPPFPRRLFQTRRPPPSLRKQTTETQRPSHGERTDKSCPQVGCRGECIADGIAHNGPRRGLETALGPTPSICSEI